MSRTKYWCFTLNNHTDGELALIDGLVESGTVTYLVRGVETGAGGTVHLQGYLECLERHRLPGVRGFGGLSRAHFEARKGTGEQAATYCKKDGAFVEFGILSTLTPGGKSSILEEAILAVKEGQSVRDLWLEHPEAMIRHERGLRQMVTEWATPVVQELRELDSFPYHPLQWLKKSVIIYGPSGTGKTSYAKAAFPTALLVSHMDDLLAFRPGEHEAIIFDDMSFLHLPRTAQIHLVDSDDDRSIHVRYQVARIPAQTQKIFTTNVKNIFLLEDRAIARRIHVICLDMIKPFV